MKKNLTRYLVFVTLIAMVAASCTSEKELQTLRERCNEDIQELEADKKELRSEKQALEDSLASIKKQKKRYKSDTALMGASLRRVQQNYKQLKNSYDLLMEKNRQLMKGTDSETSRILQEFQETQEDLLEREDRLREMEKELREKKQNLVRLQNILDRKEKAVQQLRDRVADALLGFEGKGLSIQQKHGKVYVSLEEQLLFESGKWDVSSRGVDALKQLASVLAKNPDINVLIEGHTDEIPYKGKGPIKDNWDLSVKRATSIVRILINNSTIDPKRLIAAGRSKYVPVDEANTPEARQKNRRTEIILTPKLDELFQIIEMN
ncbi:MAG: OmpA family protein [Bacteroidales bacterium]|nr:OmpA family protein [Bacteroidales bacterium]